MDEKARREALATEIKTDPAGRGYLAVYGAVGPANGGEWNVFNLLRDPAAARLAAIGVDEGAMTIEDVRAALAYALAAPVGEGA